MSDKEFEKGLQLLLNKAYNRPRPSEEFRSDLLVKLKEKQRINANNRRHRTIALFSTISAAAAMVAIAVLPTYMSSADTQLHNEGTGSGTYASSNKTMSRSRIKQLDDIAYTGTPRVQPNLSTQPVSLSSNRIAKVNNTTATPNTFNTAALAPTAKISGNRAKTFNRIEIRSNSNAEWSSLTGGDSFTLKSGMEIRTPMGAVEPVTFGIQDGPMVMLDGMSEVQIKANGIDMLDGRMVVSLKQTDQAVKINLSGQKFALQPGSMVFARIDTSNDYASGGSPVPVMVLLKGNAATLDSHKNLLAAGRVYELYDTGTGKYPSRQLGSYENVRRFMPMVNAMQAANQYK